MKSRKEFENLFPLDTFHGETKEQLLQLIESLIAEAERRRTEEVIEFLETNPNSDNDYMKFAAGCIVADVKDKFLNK